MPLPDQDHNMALGAAADLTRRHRNRMISNLGVAGLVDGCLGGVFSKAAIQRLLQQPGCTHLRFYYGEDAQGGRHVVLVGTDSEGDDIVGTSAVVLQNHLLCPPVCPVTTTSTVLRNG